MKTKIVAMIPVRMGSKRVPKKNLRLINGKPLVAYIIESAIASKQFDEIYLNSEDDIFKGIAKQYGIKFYKRPQKFATDEATNDDFAYDFMKNVKSETVIQLLATSPFITPQNITDFVTYMTSNKYDTLVSVKDVRIECIYNGHYINFYRFDKTKPSQQLIPVRAYACSMMGWNTKTYVQNMLAHEAAYHGADGNIGYFTISGDATVDIDNEEDFQLAEVIAQSMNAPKKEPQYYDPNKKERAEADVPSILKRDGVITNNLFDSNWYVRNIYEIIESMPKKTSWSHRFIDTNSNSMTAICQMKGEGNRLHYHSEWNEWWVIWQGEWLFEIEGNKHVVIQGDVVLIEKGKKHKITSLKNNSIRLAVSRADVPHIYVKK